MIVSFDLTPNVQQMLLSTGIDPNQIAKETLLLELFRRQQLSHHELAQELGLSRLETETLLVQHGIYEQSLTLKDLEADRLTLQVVSEEGNR